MVEKVFVDQNEEFIDVDDLRWNSVDIFSQVLSMETDKFGKDLNLRRIFFSNCFLWGNYKNIGVFSREHVKIRERKNKNGNHN